MARIGVDIDDVIFPWYGRAHRASERAGITNGIEPRTWYPYREYGCTREQWFAALAGVTVGDCWLYDGEPSPGAVVALTKLREAGHTIHLVTARGYLANGHVIRAKTAFWLEEWAIPHDTLTFSQDKTVVQTDWFIDDNARNVSAVWEAGSRALLVDQPWNADVPWHDRVGSIAEFAHIVLEEA